MAMTVALTVLVASAVFDVIQTGYSGYPNVVREVRHTLGIPVILSGAGLLFTVWRKKDLWLNLLLLGMMVAWTVIDWSWPRV